MTKSELASEIASARKAGQQTMITMPDPPMGVKDAMDIQRLAFERAGETSVGWKVGATNAAAQAGFKLDAPFYGPVAGSVLMQSGAALPKAPNVGAIEAEYAFKMARDYPREGEEISVTTAKDAVDTVHLALEIIGRNMGSPDFANGVGVTMDFGGNTALIIGPEVVDWASADFATTEVTTAVDGEVKQTGNGEPVMGDPINSLVWLAKALAERGDHLAAGEWVSTGTCTAPVPAEKGTTASSTFGDFGSVSVNFT